MDTPLFSHEQIVREAKFSPADWTELSQRRRSYNRLGFAYQLAFVRLAHRFPAQQPLEIDQELLTYVGLQLDIPIETIQDYQQRRQTIAEHRLAILDYLGLRRLGEMETKELADFLFEQACRLEQSGPLLVQAKQFLKEAGILYPVDETFNRLLMTARQSARTHISARITETLSTDLKQKLDALLEVGLNRITPFQSLKNPPGRASPTTMLRLAQKMEQIEATGIRLVDLSWLNNNYQRSLARYARRCSADRIRQLKPERRYGVLVCFLWQVYRDTIDQMVDMHHKLMTLVYNRAQTDIDEQTKKQHRLIRHSLSTLHAISQIILDETVSDADLRQALFEEIDQESLTTQMTQVETWLSGKYSHVFNLVVQRFSYLRQFSPSLLEHLEFRLEEGSQSSLIESIELLREMNRENKRKLPPDAPLGFVPHKLRPLVQQEGEVSKAAWECALLTVVRDEINAGNIVIEESKRFGRFDNFFTVRSEWKTQREAFFKRAGLPVEATEVPDFLTQRLQKAYDHCLETLPDNAYAQVNEDRWQLSADPAEKLSEEAKARLKALKSWLAKNLRTVKLPDLLIEVDNELHFTAPFMLPDQQPTRAAEQVCRILATLIAHGCNVGPYTMAQLTEGITYRQIKHVTDWQFSEEGQRQALALVVNAISRLDITQAWGMGKTSSSDGQRFRFNRKVLQQTYSHRFHDYALEFYSFVADNYAPFYSTVIECTDRDAAYVLDGLLYNESDLALDEHYTDTHGYTEVNFAAFAMLGRRFAPRIRGLKHQRIYRIDPEKDYGPLTPLVTPYDRQIHLDWIGEQWDRMGHFYASLEKGIPPLPPP